MIAVPANRDPQEILTLEEAAAEVEITAASLRQAAGRETLNATMVDGIWHVSRKALYDYMQNRQTRVGKARRAWAGKRLPRKPESISYRDWSIFRQYVREGRTYDEIGRNVGLSAEAVRKVVNRVAEILEPAA